MPHPRRGMDAGAGVWRRGAVGATGGSEQQVDWFGVGVALGLFAVLGSSTLVKLAGIQELDGWLFSPKEPCLGRE